MRFCKEDTYLVILNRANIVFSNLFFLFLSYSRRICVQGFHCTDVYKILKLETKFPTMGAVKNLWWLHVMENHAAVKIMFSETIDMLML